MNFFDNLFNQKPSELESDSVTTIPQSWTVFEGQNNGNPMLVRKNVGCDPIAGNKDYGVGCGIAFKFLHPTEDGFPQIEKEPELNNLEDDLFDLFEKDLNLIIPVIITTSGFREFVLYTKDVKEFQQRFEKLKENYKQYNLTSYSKPDPEWNTHESFK